MSEWHFRDLVTDHQTGKLRETAVWSNVGKAAMTWGFVYTVFYAKGAFSEALWIAYGAIVVAHEMGARYFNQKQQVIDKDKTHVSPT